MRLGMKVGGRYRLTEGPIRGGAGQVWLARDEELNRNVVLKRILSGGADSAGLDRLRAEARVLARFSHPHVVTLHSTELVGRRKKATAWLVMEYVPGGSLDHRPGMPPRLAAHVGAQIADALVALHAEGIVHGDIKPGNVVVTHEGTAKLADFGAAYRVGGQVTITPNAAVSYTPDYAAPEVVRGQPEPASDVFSLAAMVYALIAGRPPRSGGGDPAGKAGAYIAAREAARGNVVMDADVGPLREPLEAMLRRDPGRRPTAAGAMELLRAAVGPPEQLPPFPAKDPDTAPPHSGGEARQPEPGGRLDVLRRHPRRTAAGATAVVVLAAAVWAVAGIGGGKTAGKHPAAAAHGSPAVSSVMGDHRTVDPCALAEPAALGRFGQADLTTDYGNFDRCDVIVTRSSNSVVDVEVELDSGPAQQFSSPEKTTGRVTVVKEPADSGECDRALLLSGDRDAYVTVSAKSVQDTDAPATVLCDMAGVAAKSAVTVINKVPAKGEIARRPAFPANSLGRQDACTLLTAHALQVVPGVNADGPDVGFGNWNCSWESTTSDIWVQLSFDRGEPPTAADGTPTQLGGHRAFIYPPDEEGKNTCYIQVIHRAYTDQDGQPTVETLDLVVGGSDSATQLHTLATELAASAASELPSA